ncbi:MAG: hypothetical protein FJW39_01705 [Acidobacteria bacterium]|nr:hypothetical protein [Acidobacteriota bacterium]
MTRRQAVLGAATVMTARAAGSVRRVHSQPSWVISNDQVELALTVLGGHMAPVRFHRGDAGAFQPYHISPWQDERIKVDVPVLVPLRGDFFCMPFGGGKERDGREHPPHGETACMQWRLVESGKKGAVTALHTAIDTKVRAGRVAKRLMLVDGHNIVYSQHRIEGFAGPTTPGHHATLRLPDQEGSFRLASSAFDYGTTHPAAFADTTKGEYQSFAIGARIDRLSKVPLRFKDAASDADMTALPARTGYVDLMAVYKKPGPQPAWMSAVNQREGYVWFSLKDPAMLPGTVFWLENRGRHQSPWSGRNRCLGLEDVCWYFDQSYEDNPVSRLGIPTFRTMDGARPTVINYIQGAARVPEGFDIVERVEFEAGRITLIARSGKSVAAPVNHEFLRSGEL